jgi:hypothetical protein
MYKCGADRYPENLCNSLLRKSAEEAHLHHRCGPSVQLFQAGQGFIDIADSIVQNNLTIASPIKRDVYLTAAPLQAIPAARAIDNEPPHLPRGDIEKVQAILTTERGANRKMAMRMFHRVADLQKEIEAPALAKLPALAIGRDGNAIHKLHDKVGIARGSRPGIEYRCDMGMIELSQNAALMLKLSKKEIVNPVTAQNLDGHTFLKAAVGPGGGKHNAHAAPAELLLETVGAQLRTGGDARAVKGLRSRPVDQSGGGAVG